jgi:hypothetical protein
LRCTVPPFAVILVVVVVVGGGLLFFFFFLLLLIKIVDMLGSGDFGKEHEKACFTERSCFSPRKLVGMVDSLKPRLPPVRISYDEMPFESRSSDKPGFMAGHVVEVDTRFPRAKLSRRASNTVSTYLCYIVHKTIEQESIREEGEKEEEEEEEEYDLDFAATSPGAAATNYTEEH